MHNPGKININSMRKIYFFITILISFSYSINAQDTSDEKPDQIQSRWASGVTSENALNEYPRPQMIRNKWKNLNGLWDYIILKEGSIPTSYKGKILVPFPIESKLSRVQKRISKKEILWYHRTFEIPSSWNGQDVLLHFGAVDWEATVYINGQKIGSHQGGYDPFSFNITRALNNSESQEIVVEVWDPSSDGSQPIGKQKSVPEGIFYTPVSGIWQTVWLEPVPKQSIVSIKMTPDIDNEVISLIVKSNSSGTKKDCLTIKAFDGNKEVASLKGSFGEILNLSIKNPKLWSPASPYLYDLKVTFKQNNKVIDEVKSYFGMRKISLGTDKNGYHRLKLNNEFLFQFGTLDQGWWPDGLYTAPSDEALKYDIETTKKLGFNTIRKHVKVEPARWYYHCDKIGMLVWQDMPNGDGLGKWRGPSGYDEIESSRKPQSEHQYRKEWKAIMDANHNKPSIVIWVPFNEAWGQFDTEKIINWTMNYDKSRLVDGPSGGNFFAVGHMIDTHVYPGPGMPDKNLHAPKMFEDRAMILGEFGGLGLPVHGHLWQKDKNWGYRNMKDQKRLFEEYSALISEIPSLIKKGLAAAIYTQTTDVEGEVNGLMTYDREIVKMNINDIHEVNSKLYEVNFD